MPTKIIYKINCKTCNIPIETTSKKRICCGQRCYTKYHSIKRQSRTVKCWNCRKIKKYQAYNLCSRCYDYYRKGKLKVNIAPIMVCKWCKKEFKHSNTRKKYCSKNCSDASYRHSNYAGNKYMSILSRCKKLNRFLDNIIDKQKFIDWFDNQEQICIYCSCSLDRYDKSLMSCPSIDRKDNKKGYVENNLVLSCNSCNNMKSNYFTYDEMLLIGKTISKVLKQRK